MNGCLLSVWGGLCVLMVCCLSVVCFALSTRVQWRFADFAVDNKRNCVYAVFEDHSAEAQAAQKPVAQPATSIVALSLAGGVHAPVQVARGRDFYAAPRLNANGSALSFLAWDHPNMPWDGTDLCVVDLSLSAADGASYPKPVRVAGGPAESIAEPLWNPNAAVDSSSAANAQGLYFASDRSNFWNIFRVAPAAGAAAADEKQADSKAGAAAAAAAGSSSSKAVGKGSDALPTECICPMASEFSVAAWIFGNRSYDFVSEHTVAASHSVRTGPDHCSAHEHCRHPIGLTCSLSLSLSVVVIAVTGREGQCLVADRHAHSSRDDIGPAVYSDR
jgi:hypothetical protein